MLTPRRRLASRNRSVYSTHRSKLYALGAPTARITRLSRDWVTVREREVENDTGHPPADAVESQQRSNV